MTTARTTAYGWLGLNLSALVMMILLFGYIGYVLPLTIQKLDRGYDKIVQSQEIQNTTGQKNLKAFSILFNKIVNNTDATLNLTKNLDQRAEVQNDFRNQTNTLVQFLADNFGSDSGYLEKENFQYQQANKTFEYLQQSLKNQKMIMQMLSNQTN